MTHTTEWLSYVLFHVCYDGQKKKWRDTKQWAQDLFCYVFHTFCNGTTCNNNLSFLHTRSTPQLIWNDSTLVCSFTQVPLYTSLSKTLNNFAHMLWVTQSFRLWRGRKACRECFQVKVDKLEVQFRMYLYNKNSTEMCS